MTDQFFDGNRAIAEAQKCRQMLLDQTGAKSIWCIVTRKGFWPACYFFPRDEDMLREKLNRGHEVLLVFAIGRRHALASCTGYQPIQLEAADKTFRRFARRAMRQMA